FEVAVFHQGDRRVAGAAHVIVVGIDGHREIDDGVGGAQQRAGPPRLGSSAVMRKTAQPSAEAHNAADRMPAFASASCAPPKASEAISSDTMNPMPAIAPAPVTAAQPTGGRIAPRLSRVSSQAAPAVPAGFPTT